MCGIYAAFSFSSPLEIKEHFNNSSLISHRGPDYRGQYLSKNKKIFLDHHRLSILDLDHAANQPMICENTKDIILFNGEIYNHLDLRKQLIKKGIKFKTSHSDTETLLKYLIENGIQKTLNNVNGMFAFIYFESKSNKVYAVRDRLGIKPCYFFKDQNKIIFASELKSIANYNDGLDHSLLFEYFLRRFISDGDTLLKGIKKIKPATYISFNLNEPSSLQEVNYWDPLSKLYGFNLKDNEVSDMGLDLLNKSIFLRSNADVNIGCFLSSGIDSMIIAKQSSHYLNKKNRRLTTISGSIPDYLKFDETAVIRKKLKLLNIDSNHFETKLDRGDYSNDESLSYFLDEPGGTEIASAINQLYSEAKLKKLKVVLCGEGADEIFFGYSSWRKTLFVDKFLNNNSIRKLSLNFENQFKDNIFFAELLRRINSKEPIFWGGSIGVSSNLFQNIFEMSPEEVVNSREKYLEEKVLKKIKILNNKGIKNNTRLAYSFLEISGRLPELILNRADKLGMRHSIEGRFPYLDHNLVEFTFACLKDKNWNWIFSKPILRKIGVQIIGKKHTNTKKRGLNLGKSSNKNTKKLDSYILNNYKLIPAGFNERFFRNIKDINLSTKVCIKSLISWAKVFKL